MPVPTAIPAVVRLSGTIGTRLATRGAAIARTAPINRTPPRLATSVCRQTGTTRVVTPKKIPSHLSTPSGVVRPSSLSIKPFQSGLPSTQQIKNLCNTIYNKADELGLVDLTLELAADYLKQKVSNHKLKNGNTDSEAEYGVKSKNENTNTSKVLSESDLIGGFSDKDAISKPPQQTDFHLSMENSSASVLNQIRDLLESYQSEIELSSDLSESTVDVGKNRLKR